MFGSAQCERECPRCRRSQPIEAFAWKRKTQKIRQTYCRKCMAEYNRAHYLANRDAYLERARARGIAVRNERVAFLIEYFAEHPCVDCGESDPVVLEFDHLEDKAFNISEGLRDRSWQSILDEIKKCDVVCANCHRRRTARRGGFARLVAAEAAASEARAGDRGIEPRAAVLETAMLTVTPVPRGLKSELSGRPPLPSTA
jgi:hypothetical protein